MKTGRLEAFSDGVLAIIITIMVLELKAPEGTTFEDLKPLMPNFLSYLLSFMYVGIYWNNHHHMFHAIQKVNGKILWANMLLLFVMSLIPFTTAWMGEQHFEKNTVVLYGINMCLAAGFILLQNAAKSHEGKDSIFAQAIKSQKKEYFSLICNIIGLVVSFIYPIVAIIFFYIVAVIWVIPDSRIEKQLK